ncbi:MAG: TAXI family TRAP transporter solute-binding subunit [Alphaproteobacteria bacterium]|nr:TAXI family TRAP transporter solute-binding subunit [Alphaproteobacteria bacterium]
MARLAVTSRWGLTILAFGLGGALGAGALSAFMSPTQTLAPMALLPAPVVEKVLAPQLLRIGTGAVTGAYFPVGGAICQAYNARRSPDAALCVALASGGSKENLEGLRTGALEFALVQSDWHYQALHGSAGYGKARAMPELRSVLSLYKEPLTLLARGDATVARLTDLRGKRVSFGAPGSGARVLMDALQRAQGWRREDFKALLDLDPGAEADALCAGKIDVAAFITGHPNGLIARAAQACDLRLVAVAGPEIDRLLADNPFYARASIPGGLYPGNAEPVESFGVAVTLVAHARLAPDTVAAVVAALGADLEGFEAQYPALAGLAAEALIHDGLTAPPHDGAAKAWKALAWR